MRNSKTDNFETQLWVIRQIKQISAALTIGVFTLVFLDSIHILSSVLHSLNSKLFLPFAIAFMIYSVCGAFGLGVLARYAFIRHMKRVEVDIIRVALKYKLAGQTQVRKPAFKLIRGPVRQHDMNCEPSRQLRRA